MSLDVDLNEPSRQDQWIQRLRKAIDQNPSFTVEQFFADCPEATEDPIIAIELVYEHFCVQRERGQTEQPESIYQRFPQWKSQLEVVFECDRIVSDPSLEIDFPKPGDSFGDFELHHELGRGVKGRVYLATQPSLSDRPVVLKLSTTTGREHLSLARLQHSAIVPLLFAQEDSATNVRTLCMPYFGGCTLAKAMHEMRQLPVDQRSGRDFAQSIQAHNLQLTPIADDTMGSPSIRFLSTANYEQAVCWIIACLADGLHYAHQRGLLHLDVKPGNVLLATDGQPMLLDFHLARDRSELVGEIDALGGTPGYMAPEHYEAMRRIRAGELADAVIDERCDIYALGLMMHDLLSGAIPPSVDTCEDSPVRSLALPNQITELANRELQQTMRRCLATNPESRYRDASELATDLRQIAFGQQQRSPKNRFWLGAVVGVAVTSASFVFSPWAGREEPAVVLESPESKLANELHTLITQARTNSVLETASDTELQELETVCARLWNKRKTLQASIPANTAGSRRLRNDLQDLASLFIELKLRHSAEDSRLGEVEEIRTEAQALAAP